MPTDSKITTRRTLVESPSLASLVQVLIPPDEAQLDDVVSIVHLCLDLASLMYWQTEFHGEVIDLREYNALRRLCCFFDLFLSKPSTGNLLLSCS